MTPWKQKPNRQGWGRGGWEWAQVGVCGLIESFGKQTSDCAIPLPEMEMNKPVFGRAAVNLSSHQKGQAKETVTPTQPRYVRRQGLQPPLDNGYLGSA